MDFGIIKPAGLQLFRNVWNPQHTHGKTWYGFSPNDLPGYGNITYLYKTKKELKFIDFTNMNFYNDFLNHLSKSVLSFDDQLKTLFPLGFSDINVYRSYTPIIGVQPVQNTIDILCLSQLYNNRSRCSITQVDNIMTIFLKNIYKDYYDGIIMEKQLPNIIQNSVQHPEVFIFDENNVDFLGQYNQPVPGGGLNNTDDQKNIKQKLNINPYILLNTIHSYRDSILKSHQSYPHEVIQHYKNYEYIDEMEEEYGVTLPRPADAPPPKNQTNSKTQNAVKVGGAKKKHRYTRRRSRKD